MTRNYFPRLASYLLRLAEGFLKDDSYISCTAQKMKFSIKGFFSKCYQICSFLRIWSHLLRKSLLKISFFCAVLYDSHSWSWNFKIEFFPLQNDIHITLSPVLNFRGVGSISRGGGGAGVRGSASRKTSNVSCEMPFF